MWQFIGFFLSTIISIKSRVLCIGFEDVSRTFRTVDFASESSLELTSKARQIFGLINGTKTLIWKDFFLYFWRAYIWNLMFYLFFCTRHRRRFFPSWWTWTHTVVIHKRNKLRAFHFRILVFLDISHVHCDHRSFIIRSKASDDSQISLGFVIRSNCPSTIKSLW